MKIKSLNSLTKRYLFALGLIATLSLAAFFTLNNLIKTQEPNAAVINISGRQRMLSQKTALLCLQLAECPDQSQRKKIREELSQTINVMEQSHERLIDGDPGEKFYSLDQQVRAFMAEAQALINAPESRLSKNNPHLLYVLKASQGDLLQSLDNVVTQYQKQSESDIARLRSLETAILVITLLALLFEALFIFRPMVRSIRRETKYLTDSNRKLRQLSTSDGLTGIPNRRYFDEFLHLEWNRAARDSYWLALIMIDIDYFKIYNDTYGHQLGDNCLKEVAKALHTTLNRPGDFVARYGGEEFAVVMPMTDLEGASIVAEKLRANIEALHIRHSGSQVSDYVTVSLGIAATVPTRESSPDGLIKAADKALYEAKHQGRNRVQRSESIITAVLPLQHFFRG